MHTSSVHGDSRLSFWLRVREFAVSASVVESATARRLAGDWAGACAAAGVEVDLDLRFAARRYGDELAGRVRDDLRHLAPDLLRWHLPRSAPDGLLRPGLTVGLARYGAVQLVVRTPPAWAGRGQRVSLALWGGPGDPRYPHPRPSRRFRFDLHRHLWDARRSGELRARGGGPERWADEARILLRAEGFPDGAGAVAVRLGARRRVVVDVGEVGKVGAGGQEAKELPVLPDAATWTPPDVQLLRAGLITPDRLHPLVAESLVPGQAARAAPERTGPADRPRLVDCRGDRHRIGLVDGVLTALDHDPDQLRREELLFALTGTPIPCLQVIDQAHRRPENLADVRARLDHGDAAGALAVVEELLGSDALLRAGALHDELAAAARRQVAYGLFRAGLTDPGPGHVYSMWMLLQARRVGRTSRRRHAYSYSQSR
ncbi:hypothetical protein [Kitasatospora sp. NPDC093806]|uniref:hypothetical protein n=1 Tax=Kitasatospora sp. NPDC093806 TaxID=3155075 RepID=UPI0034412247